MTSQADQLGPANLKHNPLRKFVRRTFKGDGMLRKTWRSVKPTERQEHGGTSVEQHVSSVLVSPENPTSTGGIYLYGGCDVQRLLNLGRHLAPSIQSRLAIQYVGSIACSRTDILMQKLQGVPAEDTEEVLDRLGLIPSYFEPELFEPTFQLERLSEDTFNKDVVVLNVGAPITRSVYQHKEKGFLVDPGGWWLSQSLEGAVPDRETMKWFRKHFKNIGRIDVDAWEADFRKLHGELRSRTGAELAVLNVLTIEPGDSTHSYSGRNQPETVRRRAFHLRLAHLADELGFMLIDVDRLLKEKGVHDAVDFAHMPRHHFGPVMDEAAFMFQNCDVLDLAESWDAS